MTENMSSEDARENDEMKPKGLYVALCELYGWDPKCRPEDVVEAAWKAVPKYT